MVPHSRPTLIPAVQEALTRVYSAGQHVGGQERQAFEEELAQFFGTEGAIAVQSGSAALHLALLALDIPKGGRVLTTSYACASVLNSIDAVGARPLLADVHLPTLSINQETAVAACVREGISPEEVSAAIVPHMFGRPAAVDTWNLPIPLIEDAAMAIGTRLNRRSVGSYGRLAVTSFYATKMISTGQGGAVLSSDHSLIAELRDLIQYDGRDHWRASWNYPLSDLAAAMGRPQLREIPNWVERRNFLASHYHETAERVGLSAGSLLEGSCHYRYLVWLPDRVSRDRAMVSFADRGVEAKPPVYFPLHRYLELPDVDFPVTTEVWNRVLSIPLYPSLTDAEVELVRHSLEVAVEA